MTSFMSNTKFLLAVPIALAALVGSSGAAFAQQVSGGISFTGGYVPIGGSLLNTTGIDFTPNKMRAADCNGDFAVFVSCDPLFGQVGDIKDLTFAPFSAIDNFWSIGGFTFDLNDIVVDSQTASSLILNGTGIIEGNGFEATAGTWVFTANQQGGTFSWSSSTAASTPEPSAMVGLGLLVGTAYVARRRKSQATDVSEI